MEKMSGETLNLTQLNIEKVKKLFPQVITDGKVDFDLLRTILGDEVDSSNEKYQFSWIGKRETIKFAQQPSLATLIPVESKSLNFEKTKNIFIEGDNAEVLKLLQKTYYGKIQMIYIDPPYNTGNDFVYKDDYHNSIQNYLEITSQEYRANPSTSGRFHTDWLNMMYSRLLLAKNLLSDDGVIFISIDDNEIANLKKICDEIFGESNLVANICVEMSKTQGMKVKSAQEGNIVKNHEYILTYQKNENNKQRTPLYDEADVWDNHFNKVILKNNNKYELYNLFDYIQENEVELYNEFKKNNLLKNGKISLDNLVIGLQINPKIREIIYNKLSSIIYQEMACSINVPTEIDNMLNDNTVVEYEKYLLTKSSGGKIRQYRNLLENLHTSDEYVSEYCRTTIRGALWKGFYSDMMNVAKEGNIEYKNGKKPVRLIKQLLKWINDKNCVVLDFFAGSCTTAHAVMQLNAEDNGNRKFIMVQIPEPINDKSDTYDKSFSTLCDIGQERIRRAGKKIYEEAKEKYLSSGMLCDDCINPDNLDLGFKVFKLESTNIRPWDGTVKIDEQTLFDFTDTIKEDRTNLDVAYEIMLKYGIFNMPLKEIQINNKTMYNIGDGYMIICLDNEININDVAEIAKQKPHCVVFKEKGFENDNIKINATYTLERLGVEDVKCI